MHLCNQYQVKYVWQSHFITHARTPTLCQHPSRLDPHLDPAADGENVFIVSVDAGTVLTLCPLRWYEVRCACDVGDKAVATNYWWCCHGFCQSQSLPYPPQPTPTNPQTLPPHKQLQKAWDWARSVATLEDERALIRRQADGSWTGRDLDVRADARAGVLLSGDARWAWTHGTRLGVRPDGTEDAGAGAGAGAGAAGLHDWWGRRSDLMPRRGERHSVVFAFGAAEDGEEGERGRKAGGGGGAGSAVKGVG
jgi:hypothetical protein